MVDPDQMSREELMVARQRVTDQIDRLAPRAFANNGSRGAGQQIRDQVAQLQSIITEIDAELAELGPKDA